MTTNDHPLTETAVDPHHDPRPWQECARDDIRKGDWMEARSGDVLFVGVAHHQDEDDDWHTEDGHLFTLGDRWPLRRIPAPATEKDTTMTETASSEPTARTLLAVPEGHGAPHHDGDQVRAGDYIVEVTKNGPVRAGIAHHQDGEGDWRTKDGRRLTWPAFRADRPDAVTVWPAPTTPAVEVEMPSEFGDIIYDVEDNNGSTYDRMVFDGTSYCRNDTARIPEDVRAFTLPDGTRARRDGEHADGKPRFVKEDGQ